MKEGKKMDGIWKYVVRVILSFVNSMFHGGISFSRRGKRKQQGVLKVIF